MMSDVGEAAVSPFDARGVMKRSEVPLVVDGVKDSDNLTQKGVE